MFKKSLAAVAAMSLIASPVLAQSSASSASTQRAASESSEANDVFGGGPVAGGTSWLFPALAAIAAIAGILWLAGVFDSDDDDLPTSP
jgi:hypothetical protein